VKKVKDKGDPEKRAAAAAARKAAAAAAVVAQPDGHVEGKDAQKVNVGPSTDEMLKKLNIAG